MFHSNFFPPASTSDFIACKRLPLGRAKERFFLDNPYDSFNWLFAARDFVFCSLGGDSIDAFNRVTPAIAGWAAFHRFYQRRPTKRGTVLGTSYRLSGVDEHRFR